MASSPDDTETFPKVNSVGSLFRRLLTFSFVFLVVFFAVWKTNALIIITQDAQTGGQGLQRHAASLISHLTRPTDILGQSVEERKALRWTMRWSLSQFYILSGEFLFKENTALRQLFVVYLDKAVHSFCSVLGFLFIVLSVSRISGYHPARETETWIWSFLGFAYIILVGGWNDLYTTFEFMAVAGVTYAAITNRVWLYVLMATVAVANRETGVLVGFLILLFGWQGPRTLIYAAYPALAFVTFNFQILIDPDLYSMNVLSTAGSERPSMLDFWNYPPKEWVAFWCYTLLLYLPLFRSGLPRLGEAVHRKLGLALAFYFALLGFGTFLGNLFPHMILLPFLVPLVVIARDRETRFD